MAVPENQANRGQSRLDFTDSVLFRASVLSVSCILSQASSSPTDNAVRKNSPYPAALLEVVNARFRKMAPISLIGLAEISQPMNAQKGIVIITGTNGAGMAVFANVLR
jgi:hypothetical protein